MNKEKFFPCWEIIKNSLFFSSWEVFGKNRSQAGSITLSLLPLFTCLFIFGVGLMNLQASSIHRIKWQNRLDQCVALRAQSVTLTWSAIQKLNVAIKGVRITLRSPAAIIPAVYKGGKAALKALANAQDIIMTFYRFSQQMSQWTPACIEYGWNGKFIPPSSLPKLPWSRRLTDDLGPRDLKFNPAWKEDSHAQIQIRLLPNFFGGIGQLLGHDPVYSASQIRKKDWYSFRAYWAIWKEKDAGQEKWPQHTFNPSAKRELIH